LTTITIHLSKTPSSWNKLEGKAIEKYKNKVRSGKGKHLTRFITDELNRKLKEISIAECDGIFHKASSQRFDISLQDSAAEKIKCLANKFGVTPGDLISRMILDPHLF
jgi:hypothetical protein